MGRNIKSQRQKSSAHTPGRSCPLLLVMRAGSQPASSQAGSRSLVYWQRLHFYLQRKPHPNANPAWNTEQMLPACTLICHTRGWAGVRAWMEVTGCCNRSGFSKFKFLVCTTQGCPCMWRPSHVWLETRTMASFKQHCLLTSRSSEEAFQATWVSAWIHTVHFPVSTSVDRYQRTDFHMLIDLLPFWKSILSWQLILCDREWLCFSFLAT